MKKIFVAATAIVSIACLVSCGDSKGNGETRVVTDSSARGKTENSSAAAAKQLFGVVTKPADIVFEEVDFEGVGKIQMPSGGDWKKEGNEYTDGKSGMTIMVQSQADDFRDQIKEYTESFIDVNKRDAPKYELVKKEEGAINGTSGVKVEGKFNNGKEFVTRDYLFFTDKKVATLMARVPATSADKLNLIDYIVSTYKK